MFIHLLLSFLSTAFIFFLNLLQTLYGLICLYYFFLFHSTSTYFPLHLLFLFLYFFIYLYFYFPYIFLSSSSSFYYSVFLFFPSLFSSFSCLSVLLFLKVMLWDIIKQILSKNMKKKKIKELTRWSKGNYSCSFSSFLSCCIVS